LQEKDKTKPTPLRIEAHELLFSPDKLLILANLSRIRFFLKRLEGHPRAKLSRLKQKSAQH
jgi:hypothetical protein